MRTDIDTCLSCNLQYNTTHAAPHRVSLLKMKQGKQMKKKNITKPDPKYWFIFFWNDPFFYAAGCLKSILVYKDWNKKTEHGKTTRNLSKQTRRSFFSL